MIFQIFYLLSKNKEKKHLVFALQEKTIKNIVYDNGKIIDNFEVLHFQFTNTMLCILKTHYKNDECEKNIQNLNQIEFLRFF